jgi:Replication-relaxation
MTGPGPVRVGWAHGPSSHGEAGGVSKGSPTSSGSGSRTKSANGVRRGWRDLDHRLLAVLGRITERDRYLCRPLEDHRVLTTAQVADVGFTGVRRARTRLAELYALDVLDRFRPRTGANLASYHWVLGPLGAALVAAEGGVELAELDWRRGLVHDLAASQRLAHLVGVNGFLTALLRSARTRSDCQLEQWWSERRCGREWGEVVRPDGYGVWCEDGASTPFLLEHDNGTERLARLANKLEGHAQARGGGGSPQLGALHLPHTAPGT